MGSISGEGAGLGSNDNSAAAAVGRVDGRHTDRRTGVLGEGEKLNGC